VCAASRPRFAFDAAVALCRRVPGLLGLRGEAAPALTMLVDLARSVGSDELGGGESGGGEGPQS